MGNIFKSYSVLMYLLAAMVFFFAGISFAGLVDAGKGQMLAGGAIVLGYGVIAAFIAFITALYVGYKASRSVIVKLNIILTLALLTFCGYYGFKYRIRQESKEELGKPKTEQSKKKTVPTNTNKAATFPFFGTTKVITKEKTGQNPGQQISMGLGMFKPILNESPKLYFYTNPPSQKIVDEHSPYDSITFKKLENGGYDITSAPPWLVPDHLKLDYDIFYFRVQSVAREYIEVIVNAITGQTSFVDSSAGNVLYWPEFLLGTHSVQLKNTGNEVIYAKPLDSAGIVTTKYNFIKPRRITKEWMYVELYHDDFKSVGNGWIRWTQNGKLLIKYSLLS